MHEPWISRGKGRQSLRRKGCGCRDLVFPLKFSPCGGAGRMYRGLFVGIRADGTHARDGRLLYVRVRHTLYPVRITWSVYRGTIIQQFLRQKRERERKGDRSFFECPRNFVKDQFASVLRPSRLRRTPGNYFVPAVIRDPLGSSALALA